MALIPRPVLLGLLALLILAALVLGYFVQARRTANRRHAALAAARGWRVEHRRASLPAGTRLEIAAQGGAWVLRTGGQGTLWNQPEPAHDSGLILFAPPATEQRLASAVDSMGTVEPALTKDLLGELLGPAADDLPSALAASTLRIVGQPPGRSFVMLALGAGSGLPDLDAIDERIAAWVARHPGGGLYPVLSFGPHGLSLRLSQPVTDLDLAERVIDLAASLRADVVQS